MYFGLDVHKEFVEVCQLAARGGKKKRFRISGQRNDLELFAKKLGKNDQVVLEATFHTWAIYQLLKASKARVVVANPYKVRAIAEAKIKTDKIDAEVLAHLLRSEFIPEVRMPNKKNWDMRKLSSHRQLVGKQRTSVKNAIWAMLNRNLITCPYKDLFGKKGRYWLYNLELDKLERVAMDNLLQTLELMDDQICRIDKEFQEVARSSKQTQLLMTIPGVSLTTGSGILCHIENINRFKTPDELASYFGLVPRVSQSAGRCYHGRITKAGTAYGRWLAVEAAQSLALSGAPITASYHKIRFKKGHNIAVTALARKLIVLIWHMLKKQEPYRYAPTLRTGEKLRVINKEIPSRYLMTKQGTKLEDVYEKMGFKTSNQLSSGEKRATSNNKRLITNVRKKRPFRNGRKKKSDILNA